MTHPEPLWPYVIGGIICIAFGTYLGPTALIASPIIAGVVMSVARALAE